MIKCKDCRFSVPTSTGLVQCCRRAPVAGHEFPAIGEDDTCGEAERLVYSNSAAMRIEYSDGTSRDIGQEVL